jgi:general secretion pathway protein K
MILRNRSGMALILTLLAVSFMVAVTVQLSSSVNWQMQAAANQNNLVQLDAMLLSGLHLAQAALLADQQENQQDSAFDSWANLDPETLNSLFPGGRLTVQLTDLSGLLQVNALVLTEAEKKSQDQANKKLKAGQQKQDKETQQRELWLRFFRNAGLEDETEMTALLNCLADWIDTDDQERENGAETGYYNSLSPGYKAADRPVMLTDELLQIKGWKKVLGVAEEETEEPVLNIMQYLTVAGDEGKININTAPALILQSLHEQMTSELASSLIEFRQDEANKDKLEQINWYKNVAGFPGDITFDQNLIRINSSWFKIKVSATYNGMERVGEGTIHRLSTQEQELLWWKVN